MKMRQHSILLIAALLFCLAVPSAAARKNKIKLATLVPEGSLWYNALMDMKSGWKEQTNGKVVLKVYPGGVAGSETDVIRKMRIGQLHAASLSALGSIEIDPAYFVLQVPGMISSYEELDYCREKLDLIIQKRMNSAGFQVLNYGDFGHIYFFTNRKISSVDELKKMKICTYSNNQTVNKIWTKAGFNIIGLNSNDVLTGLQTGMIDGFIASPVFALSLQWFGKAKYMTKVSYGILLGVTLVSDKKWNRIKPEQREKMIEMARSSTGKIKKDVRSLDEKCIAEMKKHGLQVYEPENREEWLAPALKVYPTVRKELVTTEIFDLLIQAKEEFKKK